MDDSATRLEQELLGDARRQAERIVARARMQAAKAAAALEADTGSRRETQLAEARCEAEAQARAVAAGARLERRRRWLCRREQAFDALFATVLADLEAGRLSDRDRSLRQLLREALEAIGPGSVVVRVGPPSAALLSEAVIAEVRAQVWPQASSATGIRRLVEDTLRPGVVVESADGLRAFDNTYATRLERLRGPLRALVAKSIPATEGEDDG
jgi:V/A-type H+-transporting ATPase subunit E